jgi:hypothetical protein
VAVKPDIYFKGKNSYYWTQILSLTDKHIYVKERNVLPYLPSYNYTYVDQISGAPNGTQFNIYINGKFVAVAITIDDNGTLYAELPLPLGLVHLEVYKNDGNVLVRTYDYQTLNLYLFHSVYAEEFENQCTELYRVRNDLIAATVRDNVTGIDGIARSKIYYNFGSQVGFVKPPYLRDIDYRKMLFEDSFDVDGVHYKTSGIFKDYTEGATVFGLVDSIESVTKYPPDVSGYGPGWIIYEEASGTVSNIDHYYIRDNGGSSKTELLRPVIFSGYQEQFSLKLFIHGGLREKQIETVTRTQESYDELYYGHGVVIDEVSGSMSFIEGEHFYTEHYPGTNLSTGIIYWKAEKQQPAVRNTYTVTYYYSMDDIIGPLIQNIKPAHIKVDRTYIIIGAWDVAIWDEDKWH